jgi:hypothetical protein
MKISASKQIYALRHHEIAMIPRLIFTISCPEGLVIVVPRRAAPAASSFERNSIPRIRSRFRLNLTRYFRT